MILAASEKSRREVAEAERRQEAIYAEADGEVWRRAVYEPLHGGWELACIGGRKFLDFVVRDAALSDCSCVLELGCGSGAACDYLAANTSARIVGIERNRAQYERALRRAGDDARLTFICADATRWRPNEPFADAGLLLDTLSLIFDQEAVLEAARSALRPGRALYIADLTVGAGARPSTVEHAFEIDGFVGLRSAEELEAALFRAGFADVRIDDANADAIAAFTTINDCVRSLRRRDQPVEFKAALDAWLDLTAFYLDAFKRRELVYSWAHAS